jgi:exopolysaccharide/PEP-CTERM locus tyrosine autokinase
MSRIEKAMEKAGQISSITATPSQPKYTPEKENWEQPAVSTQGDTASCQIDIESRRLVAMNDFNLPITEEFRKMKSIVMQLIKKDPANNLLLVTSSISGEGKSITALNLAISLAQEHDQHVLIIDADLRKPSIGRYLGLTTQKGLTEYLKENAPLDDLLIKTGLGSLIFLPAGASEINPVELFSSQKMKDLLTKLKERFSGGYIVIDSSPVLPFAEARILSTLADGVVYVVKESGTSVKNIQEGLGSLPEANILGLVYNQATTASLAGGYHYYYYDYHRYKPVDAFAEAKKAGGFMSRFRKSKPAVKPGEHGHV